MSLRTQLLAFGLLTLVLPWAGMRFVQEMERSLRSGLEAALLASAGTVAAALDDQAELLRSSVEFSEDPSATDATIYAQPLATELRIDGYRDDWGLGDESPNSLPGGHRFWTAVRERYAYLFVAIQDDDLIYQQSPGQTPYGDRLFVSVQPQPDLQRWLLLMTSAPGVFRAQQTSPSLFAPSGVYDDRVVGAWRETTEGFRVEIRIPLNVVGSALGVAIVDVDSAGRDYTVDVSASWDWEGSKPGPFVHQQAGLQQLVSQFSRAGDRFRVLNQDGWVISDAGAVEPGGAEAAPTVGIAQRFFRFALRREDPPYEELEQPAGRIADESLRAVLRGEDATAWYRSGPGRNAIVAAAVPIQGPDGVLGAVLLEQASDAVLTLTNQAMLRLMTFTVLASVVVAVGLLGYATFLQFRVRRLARVAETALGPKGEINVAVPGRTASDEIGDLARSFASLLRRLREHTEYLRTLTSKLSHELRTPLAIVSTSLDNLEQEIQQDSADAYLERLRDGTERLDSILVAMSEATRMEHAISDTVTESFDLRSVSEACCRAYGDVYPDRTFAFCLEATDTMVHGSGDLVAQMLDKLIDNAVSFSAPGSSIEIELTETPTELGLAVINRGSKLPQSMREELFESLVSIRDKGDGRPHLGLGLYIVGLIAQFHRGRVEADNLPDGTGVVFRVWFPR